MDIKKLRGKLLLTQSEFAKLVGVSVNTVVSWESGKHKPSMRHLRKIKELEKGEQL